MKEFREKQVMFILAVIVFVGWLLYATAESDAGDVEVTGTPSFLPFIHRPEPTATPTMTPTPTATAVPTGPDWLIYVNEFRDLAGLDHLDENSDWSAGGVLHSRYMVKNDEITHFENSNNPWYTSEGYDAGRNGNIAVSSSTSAPDEFAVDLWMTGPFHAVGIVDPALHTTGFGSYREADGGWQMGATLDVLRGTGSIPGSVSFPVMFPKDGGATWLTRYSGNEFPDPLTSCPDYSAPSGAPIMLQLGSGNITPNVTASSLSDSGGALEFCIFDETNYVNSDPDMQDLGRVVLNGRDAIVIMPRNPLSVGETYTVSITANGQTHNWSFSVTTARRNLGSFEGEARMD